MQQEVKVGRRWGQEKRNKERGRETSRAWEEARGEAGKDDEVQGGSGGGIHLR